MEKQVFIVTMKHADGHIRNVHFSDKRVAEAKAERFGKMAGCAASEPRELGKAA